VIEKNTIMRILLCLVSAFTLSFLAVVGSSNSTYLGNEGGIFVTVLSLPVPQGGGGGNYPGDKDKG